MSTYRLAGAAVLGAILVVPLAGCTGDSSSPGSTPTPSVSQAGSGTPSASGSATPEPTPVGPSTPLIEAPPPATSAAPSTAGSLSITSVPVPKGWTAVARKGGQDEGFLGNGTPAHARSAPHAAFEIMSVGCAEVDRSRWTDPTAALEVNLTRSGSEGVAEALAFATDEQARTWFTLFQDQLKACSGSSVPAVTPGTSSATTVSGRRSYGPGDDWAEVAAVKGKVVRLYLLQDPGKQFGQPAQQELLDQLAKG